MSEQTQQLGPEIKRGWGLPLARWALQSVPLLPEELRKVFAYLVLLDFAPGLLQLVLQLPYDLFVAAVVALSQISLLLRLLKAQNGGWSTRTVQTADFFSVHI